MSTRKKHPASGTKKQPLINSYFSPKPKPNAASGSSRRLVQSSLAVRPLRSRPPPEHDDVLDLTRSTSPAQNSSESPPSAKKRRFGTGISDRSPQQSARHDLFDNDLSPLTAASPTPSSHRSPLATPAKLDEMVKTMAVTPTPSHVRHLDSMITDDPNDIVESSQTQYIHLSFTPPSNRSRIVDTQRIPAPVFTPTSHRSGATNHSKASASRAALESSASPTQGSHYWRVPSSQGEVSEPRTPQKRSWASIDQSGGSQGEQAQMPPPVLPASVLRSSVGSELERSASNGAGPPAQPTSATLHLAQARSRPIPHEALPSSHFENLHSRLVHASASSDDRIDHVPSSQGESSLAPTELGTMESPRKLPAYPSIDTDLLTVIPSSVPGSQEAPANISSREHPKIPLTAPPPDIAQSLPPRTPSHVRHRGPTSSPTNLPSPRALFSSLGLGAAGSTQGSVAPPHLAQAARPVATRRSPRFHSSQEESSQVLPPSQSPLKDSRINPDTSAAGMDGVFGMLGFGSEADTYGTSTRDANQQSVEQSASATGLCKPIFHDLPPSSPPPETPPHHAAKVAQRESQLGTPGAMPKNQGPPLLLTLERARDKTATPTPTRGRTGFSSAASRAARSSPAPASNLDSQNQDESMVEDSQAGPHLRVPRTSRNKRSQSVGVRSGSGSARPKRVTRALRPTTPSQRTPLATRVKDMDVDYVGSSDAEEEAMEMEARAPLLDVATSPVRGSSGRPIIPNLNVPSTAHGTVGLRGKENAYIHRKEPGTPTREERLPSSVSPSPVAQARYSSPSPLAEDTQTQDETETPWETLRPSQSVSQVLERRIVEEMLAEAERGRILRAEEEAKRERERAEEAQREAQDVEMAGADREEVQRVSEIQMATTTAPRRRSPSAPTVQVAVPPTVSTPKSRRVLDREMYVVTPTKIVKRTPVKVPRDRVVTMTPSSPVEEDEGETEEYTYMDETFNPTESQRSFLNRIVNASSELE